VCYTLVSFDASLVLIICEPFIVSFMIHAKDFY